MPQFGTATRAQLRTDVVNVMDAAGSTKWDTTMGTGEMDRRLGVVHRREWKRILNANPNYVLAMYTPTTDGSGNIPLSALSSGSGDTQQNVYRVRIVGFGANEYQYVEASRFLLPGLIGSAPFVWYQNYAGSPPVACITIPNMLNTQASGIWVNWLPTRFDKLASDASVPLLPEDYEDVFALEGAAALLMKGGEETGASQEFRAEADRLRKDLLADMARLSTSPATVAYGDSQWEWGG